MNLFSRSWAGLREAVDALEGAQWLRSSGCAGWQVQDLVFHLIMDAQDVLITLASPTDAEPTVDALSYWELGQPQTGAEPHAVFVRRGAQAYGSVAGMKHHFDDLTAAAGRAAAAADPARRVTTRGEVLTVADYLDTYVVESTLHHLDLIAHLPELPGPSGEALAATRRMLEDLAGATISDSLDDRDAVLVVTGRRPATEGEAQALRPLAARLPLILGYCAVRYQSPLCQDQLRPRGLLIF